ncbi:hypothetical protein ACFL2A_02845 [Thermodesulfobacteriota bacterium]
MTLCIANKVGSTIILAADSRITHGGLSSDHAIKVMPLSIRISSPTDSVTGESDLQYNSSFGFAFAGSFSAQNAIKDFLTIVFQQLQHVPILGPLTFEAICEFVMGIYKHIAERLYYEMEDGHVIDFFLCGTCPNANIVKLAKYSINWGPSIDKCDPKYDIFNDNSDFPIAIGAGEDSFRQEYDKLTQLPVRRRTLKALQTVINDSKVPSVGGNIQYGKSCLGEPFSIRGITMPEFLKDSDRIKGHHFCYGGIDVYDDKLFPSGSLSVSGTFLDLTLLYDD